MDSCVEGTTNVTSTCRGVLLSSLMNWISVSILVGIRLRTAIFMGLMSWDWALLSLITNMFSLSSAEIAGSPSGMFIGIYDLNRHDCRIYLFTYYIGRYVFIESEN